MASILTSGRGFVEATSDPVPTWQQAMKLATRSGRRLCEQVRVPIDQACGAAEEDFSVFVPQEYVHRMRLADALDPLFLQAIGRIEERTDASRATNDPVGDLAAQRTAGLLQKYHRRVLMIVNGTCAIHCRYCFRRHFPYNSVPSGKTGWNDSLSNIAQDPSIEEVILSGGDPLTVPDSQLAWLIEQLGKISHVRRIRIHSRVPVVIPQRICEPMLKWVAAARQPIYFVMHFNHANEINASIERAMHLLHAAGATLLNQSVLLRGINDSTEAQAALCSSLVDMRVLPYYLHQLDPVQGAMHFEVADDRARQIHRELRAKLPGYAVPSLVREIPGEPNKTPL